MPIEHVSQIKFGSMLPETIERELRAQLRDYIAIMREYVRCRDSGQNTDDLTQKLETHRDIIFKLQQLRDHWFRGKIKYADDTFGLSTPGVAALLRSYRSERATIPTDLDIHPFDSPLIEERKFYDTAIYRLEEELKHRGVQIEPEKATDPAEKISETWRAKKNAVMRLERERDEELRTSPESMHKTIKRVYGKAIDAIMEED